MKAQMADTPAHGGTGLPGTMATIFLFLIARFTLTDIAAIMTILVAATTGALNIQKFLSNRKTKPPES